MTTTDTRPPDPIRPAAPGTGRTHGGPRTAWLDNVRVWLTVLVLAHHAALTYSHIPLWPHWEPPRDPSATALDVLVGVNQTWFMGAFFLISGFFVPAAVDRHGASGFARGRLLRLGVPYLLATLVLSWAFVYPAWADQGARASGVGFLPYWAQSATSSPLWFVLVLLVFSLVYAGVRALGRGADAGVRLARVPGVWVLVGAGLALGVLSWVWQIGTPQGAYWPVVGLPSPAYLPQYALAFAAGILAARRRWLQDLRVRTAWACVPVLLVALVLSLVVLVVGGDAAAGGGTALSLLAACATSVFAVATTVVTLTVFRSWLDRRGRVWRLLSEQAFAVYVLHATILVWLGVALAGFTAPAVVKAAVLLAAGLVVTWAAAWLLRRIPLARKVF